MNNQYLKLLLPHLISVVALVLFALIYFSPAAFDGKVLQQSDTLQADALQSERIAYAKKEGRDILWTNSMFAGMPIYQGVTGETYNIPTKILQNVMFLGDVTNGSYTFPLLFTCLFCAYLMFVMLGVNWKYALAGSLLFGVSSTHIILIEAGHTNKVMALAYLAPLLGSILMVFRGRYLLGGALVAVFASLEFGANHIQITYYFLLLLAILGIVKFIQALKEGEMAHFAKAAATLVVTIGLGFLTVLPQVWTQYDYAAETIRGKSDLVSAETGTKKEGLTKDYAFSWSIGKLESFSFLMPNFMGSDSGEYFARDPESESLKALRSMGNNPQVNNLAQATTKYWGDQPFTSGAVYYGAVILLLFFLGVFLLKTSLRNWILASMAVIAVIGWGKNFAVVNYFLFDYFPFFNKFRSVGMVFGIGHLLLVALGILGLKAFLNPETDAEKRKKSLLYAAATVGGLCVLALLYSFMGTLAGPNDDQIAKSAPQLLGAIRADRAGLIQGDAFRSLFFVLAAAGVLFASLRMSFNPMITIALVTLLGLADMIGVDKRYLSNDDFVTQTRSKQNTAPRPVDTQIMQDKDLSYRVLDLSRGGNPFANGFASFYHKSIGGYYAAKLMIFQEVVDRYMSKGGATFQQILNMLNTRYIIQGSEEKGAQPQAARNPDALGNAWFVKNYTIVENANAEMDSLENLQPLQTAIIQKKFAENLNGLNIKYDSANSIKLTNYVPDFMTYETKAATEQLAVFSEIYYPEAKGWHAYIDGNRVAGVLKADYLLRALRVPAGDHKLEMRFEPSAYSTGNALARVGSALVMLLLLGALYWTFKKK